MPGVNLEHVRQEHAHAKGIPLILQSGEDASGVMMLAGVGDGHLNPHKARCTSNDSFSHSPHLSL